MQLQILWEYKTKKGFSTLLQTDFVSAFDTMLLYEDIQQTGRVKSLKIVDEYNSTWSIKELKKYCNELKNEPTSIEIYFDGGFNQQTKESGLGIVIYYIQNNKHYRIRKNYTTHSLASNNEAEYTALHYAIQQLEWLNVKAQSIKVFGDSQVVIQQMSGEWPIYEQGLEYWANKIDALLSSLNLKATYTHISRKENEEADHLATQALNSIEIDATIEIK